MPRRASTIVDPVEVQRRLKRKLKVPKWMVRVAREKEEIARTYGTSKVTIYGHWAAY